MAKLHFNYSAMNAGKSTALLQANHNYQERGMQTILFTAGIDDRAGRGVIKSRIGIETQAVAFEKNDDLAEIVRTKRAKQYYSKIRCRRRYCSNVQSRPWSHKRTGFCWSFWCGLHL